VALEAPAVVKKTIKKYREDLTGLAVAYNRVFDKDNVYTGTVLKDLAKFCRAHESTFHQDPRGHAVLEGRREVWLKIQEFLNLSIDEIYDLHKIKEFIPRRIDGEDG
jgi:hypothetical protein